MVNPYEAPVQLADAETPSQPVRTKYSTLFTVVMGLVIPGLPTLLIRRNRSGQVWFVLLLSSLPLAYGFFGPFWDVVLFDGTPYDQAGFYPFIASCVLVPIASAWRGLRDRRLSSV